MRHMVCLSLLRFGTFSRRYCFSASSSDIDPGRKICFLGEKKNHKNALLVLKRARYLRLGLNTFLTLSLHGCSARRQ